MGPVGALAFLIGVVMMVAAVIPAVRRRQKHIVRNALVLLVGGLVLVGVAPAPEGSSTAASSAQSGVASSSTAAAVPTTPAEGAARVQAALPVAGTPQVVDRWVLQGGSSDRAIAFRRSLGNEFLGTTADSGYTFALVPVFVKNNTTRTETMGFATWILRDDRGYEYTTETMADLYLSERERLNVTNVPPDATRFGYLVFQVHQGATGLTLEFGSGRNQRVWRFANL